MPANSTHVGTANLTGSLNGLASKTVSKIPLGSATDVVASLSHPNRPAVGTYRERLFTPDPLGQGIFSSFLGDPKQFKGIVFDRNQQGQWLATKDTNGNAWLVLVKSGDGSALYDWDNIYNLGAYQQAHAPAAKRWYSILSDLDSQTGLIDDMSAVGSIVLGRNQDGSLRGDGSALSDFELGSGPSEYWHIPLGSDSYVDSLARFGFEKAYIEGNGIPQGTYLMLYVDYWTRTAYIDRIMHDGEPNYQEITPDFYEMLGAIVKTFVDVLEIIAGAFTGNIKLIESALADIVVEWYTFSADYDTTTHGGFTADVRANVTNAVNAVAGTVTTKQYQNLTASEEPGKNSGPLPLLIALGVGIILIAANAD